MNFEQVAELLRTYNGRINRGRFWIATALYLAAYLVIAFVVFLIFFALIEEEPEEMILMIPVLLVLSIPMIISGIFVGIKRLHDRSKSGWWLLLFYGAPSALNVIAGNGAIVSLISFAISIWAVVELGCLKGDTGPNAYGPDPLQSSMPG